MPRIAKSDPEDTPVAIDWDKLPSLTDLEHDFLRRVLAGERLVDAFREAYGDSVSHYGPGALANRAMRNFNDERMQIVFAAMLESFMGAGKLDLGAHDRNLERIRERALATGNFGAAFQAEVARGKAAGLYVERVEDVTPADPLEVLRKWAKRGGAFEAMARQAADQHGIPWESVDEKKPAQLAIEAPAGDVETNT